MCNNNTLVAQTTEISNCIELFGNDSLNNLNWEVDSNYSLIIFNDYKCDSGYIFSRSGQISLILKSKINDSIVSTFVLRTLDVGEINMAITDYNVIYMGYNEPSVILIKISYISVTEIGKIDSVRLFKLECKDGRLIETHI